MLIECDHEDVDIQGLVEPASSLLATICSSLPDESANSAHRVSEHGDRYLISQDGLTLSSTGFTSKSELLYNAQQLLEKYVAFCI